MRDDAKIRQQLLLEKAILKYRYGRAQDDAYLTDWLVKYLGDNGVTDIRNLAIVNTVVSPGYQPPTIYGSPQDPPIVPDYVAAVTADLLTDKITGKPVEFIGIGLPGEYQAVFETVFSPDGVPFFTARVWYNPGSVLKQFEMAVAPVLPVIMVAMAILLPGAGAMLAQSVFGSGFAAAYPTLASAVGNIAINTAFNGGNIESAVKGVALSNFGGIAGANAAALSDSAMVGSVTSAAVSAMLSGGDIGQAVAFSLAGTGAKTMGDYLSLDLLAPPSVPIDAGILPPVDPFGAPGAAPFSIDFSASPVSAPLATLPDTQTAPVLTAALDPTQPLALVDFGNASNATNLPGFTVPPLDTSPGSPTTTDAAGVNWGNVASTVSTLAIAALKILPAYINAGKPALQMGATRIGANGATTVVNPDGTITVHAANGASSTKPIPVGTPYLLPDASLVTNNGDGTYSRVSASGGVVTAKYLPSAAGLFSTGGSGTAVAVGVLLLGTLLLVARR
jgi:hypothetical protein